jgi:hypothetical protein
MLLYLLIKSLPKVAERLSFLLLLQQKDMSTTLPSKFKFLGLIIRNNIRLTPKFCKSVNSIINLTICQNYAKIDLYGQDSEERHNKN